MNAFEALGVAYWAHVGGRVLVVYDRVEQIRNGLEFVTEQARTLSNKVRVVQKPMEQRVEVGALGGEVVFTFRRSSNLDDYKANAVLTVGMPMMSEAERDKYTAIAGGGPVVCR